MGRIHVLSEQVANKIAAGEVVERPASVVKELLENALDAGATRIKISVEAGGKKLIQITDNGCGMVRDDAMLAFERHATSKIKDAEDLLSVATLGFRGEALPSIASVSRLRLETCAVESGAAPSGTIIEINGGKMARVEEAGLPEGTSITVRDLFFNTPARKKFLKAESTELSHIASLVTHYALAHPEKHFELHSATNAMLVAPPVAGYSERVYQVFGKETLDQLIAVAAVQALEHVGLPQPPPWRRKEEGNEDAQENVGTGPDAAARLRFEAGDSEAESQFDLCIREWPADSRPAGAAWTDRGLSQHYSAERVSRGAAVSGIACGGSGCECSSLKNGSALSAADGAARFCAGHGARGADEGASGAAVHHGDSCSRDRQFWADAGRAGVGAAF